MGLRQHKKAIQIGSAIMIGIFAISMLVTGILFLKNKELYIFFYEFFHFFSFSYTIK